MLNILLIVGLLILYIPQLFIVGNIFNTTIGTMSLFMSFWERFKSILMAICVSLIMISPLIGTLISYYIFESCDELEIPYVYKRIVPYFYIIYSWVLLATIFNFKGII